MFGMMDPENRSQTPTTTATNRTTHSAARQLKTNWNQTQTGGSCSKSDCARSVPSPGSQTPTTTATSRTPRSTARQLKTNWNQTQTGGSCSKSDCARSMPSPGNPMEPIAKQPAEIYMLPDEILLRIFTLLQFEDFVQSAYVCRRWQHLIKGGQSLWRQKEYLCKDLIFASEVRKITAVMPRLKVVRLLIGWRSEVRIAWPETTVVIYNTDYWDTPECEEYQCVFPTDMLLVSRVVAAFVKHFINWVEPQSLKVIYVGEQCTPDFVDAISFSDTLSPLMSYSESTSCDVQDCILHKNSPSLYQIPLSSRKTPPGPSMGNCLALEQVSVRCAYLSDESLGRLCSLSPMRVFRIVVKDLDSLSFLKFCPTQLEVLSIKQDPELPADIDAY